MAVENSMEMFSENQAFVCSLLLCVCMCVLFLFLMEGKIKWNIKLIETDDLVKLTG